MRCPACGHDEDRVVDSRAVQGGGATRRRRECVGCGFRFTTYERIEEALPMIVKRDGRREPYNRDKVLSGIRIACRKRPVSAQDIESLVDRVERALIATGQREVESGFVGDQAMAGLRRLDPVAYVRFASVYQSFDNIQSFVRLLESLKSDKGDAKADVDSPDPSSGNS
jgi:transcriptional repressor NrdR